MSDERDGTSRRTFLSAVGATGAFLGVGEMVTLERQQVAMQYRLGGRVSGWQGRDPSSIAQTTNPTLNLQADTEYEITWENVDGAPHNVAILGQDGTVLERTEIINEQGATQTLRFTATREMSVYICQVHPDSMRGEIAIGRREPGGNQTQNQTGNQTMNQTTTVPNPTEAPVNETEHPLAGRFGENPQKFVARLKPPTDVQTDATGTAYFTLHPPNGAEPVLMYVLHVENLNQILSASIHLDAPERNNPVVAPLFARTTPTGNVTGTVVDATLTAGDLRGPFRNESLLRLTEAIHNDNVFVMVRTMDHPIGALQGPITPAADSGVQVGTAVGTGTPPTVDERRTAEEVGPNDLTRRVQMPGFGVLAALGGLAGGAGYLLSRSDENEE